MIVSQEIANILAKGAKLREYTKGVENNVRQVELESIQVHVFTSSSDMFQVLGYVLLLWIRNYFSCFTCSVFFPLTLQCFSPKSMFDRIIALSKNVEQFLEYKISLSPLRI